MKNILYRDADNHEKAIEILKDFVSEDHPNMKTFLANYEYAKKQTEEAE